MENKINCLKLCPKRLSNYMQCLDTFNLKFIYLCKKNANQTTSAGGQKWISKHTLFLQDMLWSDMLIIIKHIFGQQMHF